MASGIAVPAPVLAWLRAINGDVGAIRATSGGFSHLTFFCEIGGSVVAVKAASQERKRGDVAREAAMLDRLDGHGLPVPGVLEHTDDADGWTVVVTSVLEGEGGIGVLQERPRVDVVGCGIAMGALMRRVHACASTPGTGARDAADVDLAARAVVTRAALEGERLDGDIASTLDAALGDPLLRSGTGLVHGDFGFHNTLWEPGQALISGLLDWEWSGWGSPLTDLAWLWWTLRFRRAPDALFDAVIDTYGRAAARTIGWSSHGVHSIVCAQMAQILLRTEPATPAREEWERRIRGVTAMPVPSA